jgi:hypothetical protein
MLITLFLCLGFMMAVLYIDLMFDIMAAPYRKTNAALPKAVLDPITHYYGRITQNPYVLMFVMLTALLCIGSEILYNLVPRWAAYASLGLMLLSMMTGVAKVIPTAQRLGAGTDTEDERTRMVHSMMPFHLILMVNILLLTAIQFSVATVVPR